MAIDVQPPNYSGLVALAGKSAPLNLQPTGALGLQALQQQQANDASLRQNAIQQAQLQQQGQLGLLANQTQQQGQAQQAQYQQGLLADQQQKNASGAAQAAAVLQQNALKNQGALGMDMLNYQQTGQNQQANQTIAEQKNILDAHKQMMDQFNKDSTQALTDKGAFASYGLISMKNAATPDQANQTRQSIIQEAVGKGYMTKDQAAQAGQMPGSQFNGLLGQYIVAAGTAKDHKDMVDANKAMNPAATGVQATVGPDGTLTYSSTPTPAENTGLQKSVVTEDQMLKTLGELKNTFNSKYLTYAGRGTKEISQEAEKLQGIPGVGTAADYMAQAATGMNTSDRANFIDNSTQYLHSAGQMFQKYIQQMAGSRVSAERIQQFEALFANPTMSPTEYKSGISQLLRDITTEKQGNQAIIKGGVNVTPPTDANAAGNPAAANDAADPNAGMIQHLQSFKNPDGSAKYSPQQITDYINTLGKK